jgi:hypothetical protein
MGGLGVGNPSLNGRKRVGQGANSCSTELTSKGFTGRRLSTPPSSPKE